MVYYQLTKYDANSDIQILDLNGFINNMSRRNGSSQNDWYKHKYALKWKKICDTTVVVEVAQCSAHTMLGPILLIYRVCVYLWCTHCAYISCIALCLYFQSLYTCAVNWFGTSLI